MLPCSCFTEVQEMFQIPSVHSIFQSIHQGKENDNALQICHIQEHLRLLLLHICGTQCNE